MTIGRIALGVAAIALAANSMTWAEEHAGSSRVLFKNVNVYDGINATLLTGANVLVEGNLIRTISTEPLDSIAATVIDGGGRTLTPGLIDTHVHLQLVVPAVELEFMPAQEIAVRMVPIAEDMLMRGFTTVRDTCGNTHGLRDAINAGVVAGPRIVSAGACIGGWSSHADFFTDTSVKGQTNAERVGFSRIADGPDEIRLAIREEMRKGASFIKLMIGGGLASTYDPIDTNTMSAEEIRAAVEETESWGTYATAHVYNDVGINRALDAGMITLEHMHLGSRKTYQRLKKMGLTLSAQVAVVQGLKGNPVFVTAEAQRKAAFMQDNGAAVFEYMRELKIPVGFGVDSYGSFEAFRFNSKAIRLRKNLFPNEMILEQIFKNNVTLLEMTGERLPYKDGRLGRIEEGAYADLLLVKGDPTEDVAIFADWDKNIDLIMKDGVIYKNSL